MMLVIEFDVVLLYVNVVDWMGNMCIDGFDLFFDVWMVCVVWCCYVLVEMVDVLFVSDDFDVVCCNLFECLFVMGVVYVLGGVYLMLCGLVYGWDLLYLCVYCISVEDDVRMVVYLCDVVG